jgi:23S rRNA (guanosine2251-2'-O)-methyltransferase
LENIEDPHNLGALIRTALSAGVDFILIPKDRSAGPSSTVSRSSAGAMEHADIYMITNTASILKSLKEKGVWVFGLDADGNKSLFDADLKGHIALVIGGENKGVRPLVKKECDFLLSIPNKGKLNSLNASVAGGIAMYEALRQRNDIRK